ncbi:hypothetical protein FisN_13Lh170 [Fistulifera solaris]|uniref:Uncharacterized protein n=1 Tax=Fistulifera solaris TaxID=1519565 RepID=A0A1Z5KLV7_FISSO|nr:hypothetical protein FisN_13Lh170 [Fistulifera solaris]|eukprot:GAX27266.1 hypothetical protein FisN_13Lh170 [Fistulifera solaris]
MPGQNEDRAAVFEMMPVRLCKPEQLARWRQGGETSTYKLLRTQFDLEDFISCSHRMAIWRENNTLTYVTPYGSNELPEQEFLTLKLRDKGATLRITGRTHEAISQTAALFLNLVKPIVESDLLSVDASNRCFDFRAAQSECLSRIFEAAPTRHVRFQNLKLSAQQSITLATRPHVVHLTFSNCELEDEGTAFLDYLEKRTTLFGTVRFINITGLNRDNLQRLLQLDMIERLCIHCLEDEGILPFSTKAKYLDYDISSSSLLKADLNSLHNVPSKLALSIEHESDDFPTEPVVALFRRIAAMGHFEELKISFCFYDNYGYIPGCVVQSLIQAAIGNINLQVLDLSTDAGDLKWDSHVGALLQGLKDHINLRVLQLSVPDTSFGPDFADLRQLLTHNCNIIVTREDGSIYSDGGLVDELYSLNRFVRCCSDLAVKPTSERLLLVTTALMGRALNDFQCSSLLLSKHADLLCEYEIY